LSHDLLENVRSVGQAGFLRTQQRGIWMQKRGVGAVASDGTVYPWRDALLDFTADAQRSVSLGILWERRFLMRSWESL